MASFKFILKFKKSKKTGKKSTAGRVHLLYTHDSKTCEFSTGRTSEKKHWDSESGKYKGHDNAMALNKVLTKFKEKIEAVAIDLQGKGIYPAPPTLKIEFDKSEREKQPEHAITSSMSHLWKVYLDYLKNTTSKVTGEKRTDATINSNRNSKEAFEKFLVKNKIEGIQPAAFTIPKLHKWEEFLQSEYPSANSRSKRQKHFKAACKHFKKIGYPIGFDLDEISYKERARPKVHINEEELKTISDAGPDVFIDRLADYQAYTVLGCNTGLRISDLKRVHENIDGDYINIQGQKTSEPIQISITPTVRAILERYKYKLPVIPEQKIRKGAKEVFKKLFPEKTIQIKINGQMTKVLKGDYITPHSWVKSFVTISAKRGMPLQDIAVITKKSMAVLLKHYLAEDQEAANKSMQEKWGVSPLKVDKSA